MFDGCDCLKRISGPDPRIRDQKEWPYRSRGCIGGNRKPIHEVAKCEFCAAGQTTCSDGNGNDFR